MNNAEIDLGQLRVVQQADLQKVDQRPIGKHRRESDNEDRNM